VPIRAQTLVCVIIFTRRQVPALNVNLETQPVWIMSLHHAQVESILKLKQLHYSYTGSVLRFSAVQVHARVKFPNWKPRRNLRRSHTPWDSQTTDPTLLHNITYVWSRIPSCDYSSPWIGLYADSP